MKNPAHLLTKEAAQLIIGDPYFALTACSPEAQRFLYEYDFATGQRSEEHHGKCQINVEIHYSRGEQRLCLSVPNENRFFTVQLKAEDKYLAFESFFSFQQDMCRNKYIALVGLDIYDFLLQDGSSVYRFKYFQAESRDLLKKDMEGFLSTQGMLENCCLLSFLKGPDVLKFFSEIMGQVQEYCEDSGLFFVQLYCEPLPTVSQLEQTILFYSSASGQSVSK